jgi:hypothetical protein
MGLYMRAVAKEKSKDICSKPLDVNSAADEFSCLVLQNAKMVVLCLNNQLVSRIQKN